jgi:parvulin-like peptidyl-prolyl isomerase
MQPHRLLIALITLLAASCAPERPSDIARARQETTDTRAARAESARKQIVAEIAGESISREQLERRLGALSPALRNRYASTTQRQELLPTLVIFEALADEGERAGLGRAPQVREALREELALQYVEAELRRRVPPDSINDAAIAAYYDANPQRAALPERRQMVALDADTRAELDALIARWQATTAAIDAPDQRVLEFRKLAARYSTDRAAANKGGELGWVEPPGPIGGIPNDLQRLQLAAFPAEGLAVGQLTAPFELEDGTWRVAAILKVEPARIAPLDEIKTALRDELYAARRAEARAAIVREALAKHAVKTPDVSAAPAPHTPPAPPPEPLSWLIPSP